DAVARMEATAVVGPSLRRARRQSVLLDLLATNGDTLEMDVRVRSEFSQPAFEIAVDLDTRRVVVPEVVDVRRLAERVDLLGCIVDVGEAGKSTRDHQWH